MSLISGLFLLWGVWLMGLPVEWSWTTYFGAVIVCEALEGCCAGPIQRRYEKLADLIRDRR